jgi:hypothetical protein
MFRQNRPLVGIVTDRNTSGRLGAAASAGQVTAHGMAGEG